MPDFKKSLSDIQKTLALSVAFHILLVIILLLIGTGFDFDNREFAEVAFIASSRPPRSKPVARTPSPPPAPKETQPKTSEETPASKPEETMPTKRTPVQLPKRRMLEQEEPEPLPRETEKMAPSTVGPGTVAKRDALDEGQYEGRDIAGHGPGEKVSAGTSPIPQGGKEMAPSGNIGGPTSAQPFYIEGDAAQRTIRNKVIPEYPTGLQKEAIVKIRFTVLPDGRVGKMIPMLKGGDATLEQITMNALRQWRFNPLSPSVPQVNVQGIITFNYVLR
jgi:protein TonB